MTERDQLQALVRKWRGSRSVLVQGCAGELAAVIAYPQLALPIPTDSSPLATTEDVRIARQVVLAEMRLARVAGTPRPSMARRR